MAASGGDVLCSTNKERSFEWW